jgi:hypothetical protein
MKRTGQNGIQIENDKLKSVSLRFCNSFRSRVVHICKALFYGFLFQIDKFSLFISFVNAFIAC